MLDQLWFFLKKQQKPEGVRKPRMICKFASLPGPKDGGGAGRGRQAYFSSTAPFPNLSGGNCRSLPHYRTGNSCATSHKHPTRGQTFFSPFSKFSESGRNVDEVGITAAHWVLLESRMRIFIRAGLWHIWQRIKTHNLPHKGIKLPSQGNLKTPPPHPLSV